MILSRRAEWMLAGSLTVSIAGILVASGGQAEEVILPPDQSRLQPVVTTVDVLKQTATPHTTAVDLQQTIPATPENFSPIAADPAPSGSPANSAQMTFTPISVQGRASFTSGPGVGYESSFFGMDGFVPLTQTPGKDLTYLQGRLLLSTDGGNPGGNLLVGLPPFQPCH
jgi:hypothetical protein